MNILLSAASSLPSGEIPVLIWATVGGVLVFIGLAVEKFADWMNDQYLGGPEKPHKPLETAGWCILMVGIFVEIAVAGSSANDAWETRQIAIKSNPLNQPISVLSAVVDFKVKEDNPFEITNSGSVAWMLLCESNSSLNTNVVPFFGRSQLDIVVADSFGRFFDGKTLEYVMNFRMAGYPVILMHGVEKNSNENPKTVEWALKNVRFLDITTKFLPHNAEILGGSVVLTINSGPQKWFDIPAQKDLDPNAGNGGYYEILASMPTPTNTVEKMK